jgi:integrase
MRWTGLRINDVLMLPRSALRGDRLRLVTKKTKAEYDERIPLDAIAAFAAIPPRPGVHPDYYFWSRTCTYRTLVATWCERIQQLNKFLTFQDEDGKPMPFRSHQLRDMFAIELLLRGVPMEDVSRMLTHKSIGVTEKHYAPFVKRRKQQLEAKRIAALEMMGATFSAQTGSPAMTAGPVLQA